MTLDDSLRKRIADLVQGDRVVLFMKGTRAAPACGFSAAVVGLLDARLDDYRTVDVLADPALRDGIKEFTNWPTIPQLYVAGKFVGGCDIVRELDAAGELDALLGGPPRAPAPAPRVTLTEAAATAVRAALQGSARDRLRLEVSPGFDHDLAIGPPEPGDVEVTAGGITLALDRESARRADGVRIDYVETPDGAGFKIDNPAAPPRVRQLRPQDLRAMLDRGERVEIFDVRPAPERRLASIAGARPLEGDGEAYLLALPRETPVVFQCHHGVRSQAAAERVVRAGFRQVYNLAGGIDAWSVAVDPAVPRY